ncbi:MAG: class I SAM-dependent methyltransferase [Cyclobacteriaceae bacterium]
MKIRTFDASEDVHEPTIFSNKRRIVRNADKPHPTAKYIFGVDTEQASSKSDLLINPLRSIDKVRNNFSKLKVLSIGPRTEGEMLNLIAHGFRRKNIKGLDLLSYSPWIEIGDMHNMPFGDKSFDIVICGWVIAYSDNKMKAAKEIVRVLKSGGIASIGVSFSPLSNEEIEKKRGYLIATPDRLESTSQIVELFGESVDRKYFLHDIEDENRDKYGQIITSFSIKK